jgi:flagellar biosynthetic protein FlhB
MDVPVVVAKGVDNIALKIREVARENDVPVLENPPLARSLFATVEVDEEIREDHYKAVAEVVGYILRLKKGEVAHYSPKGMSEEL